MGGGRRRSRSGQLVRPLFGDRDLQRPRCATIQRGRREDRRTGDPAVGAPETSSTVVTHRRPPRCRFLPMKTTKSTAAGDQRLRDRDIDVSRTGRRIVLVCAKTSLRRAGVDASTGCRRCPGSWRTASPPLPVPELPRRSPGTGCADGFGAPVPGSSAHRGPPRPAGPPRARPRPGAARGVGASPSSRARSTVISRSIGGDAVDQRAQQGGLSGVGRAGHHDVHPGPHRRLQETGQLIVDRAQLDQGLSPGTSAGNRLRRMRPIGRSAAAHHRRQPGPVRQPQIQLRVRPGERAGVHAGVRGEVLHDRRSGRRRWRRSAGRGPCPASSA